MIRRPGAVADRSFVRPGDRPAGPGLDVADRNVAAWGGDLAVYRSALSAALRTGGPVPDLAAVAAWRAGVVELREDVLARLPGLPAAAAAAALGIPVALLGPFLAAQAGDRFARPDPVPAGALLHRVGGFGGLGGPWLAPPVSAEPAGPGRFLVSTHDGAQWTIVADAWGARLRPASTADTGPAGRVRVVVPAESYLVEVRAG